MRMRWTIVACVLFAIAEDPALGGVITAAPATQSGYYSGTGTPAPRSFGPSVATPHPNNGPTAPTGSVNFVGYSNNATNRVNFATVSGSQGPIDFVYPVTSSTGVTQYDFLMFTRNSTGVNFGGYSLQLGTGTGAGFVPATLSGLSFDTSPVATTKFDFAAILLPTIHTATLLRWPSITNISGVNYGNSGINTGALEFSIEVPDDPGNPSGYSFTLRAQYLPLPEPGAGVLLLGSILSFASIRRRR